METFPSYPANLISLHMQKIPMFNTYIVEYGKSKEQRLIKRSRVQYRLAVLWDILEEYEKDLIEQFFITRKGAYEPFIFIDPTDSSSYVARFEEDLMNFEYFSYGLWKLNSVNLLEVIGPCLRTPAGSIDFGQVAVSSTDDETITIYNDGNTSLYVFAISRILGSTEFTCLTSVPFTMVAGASKAITIRFAPLSTGVKNATFVIRSYDPYNPALTFGVTGEGI